MRTFRTRAFYLLAVLSIMLLPAGVSLAAGNSVEHFKMLSTIEYNGQGQFTNQIETLFTVEKKPFIDGSFTDYLISTTDFDLVSKGQSSFGGLSFVIEKSTSRMVKADKELMLHQQVNNQCVGSLERVTRDNVGKTWKQTFNLSLPDESIPRELKFTISAIEVKTDAYGEMIAVRALSNPFKIQAEKADGGKGNIKARINAVYLFDSEMEDIYLSMSVLEVITKIGGSKETLRHEVATYKTNASGQPVDLSGLDKKFAKFVKRIGLAKNSLEIVNESPLPLWAQSFATGPAQVANILAAIACEGGVNPVVIVSLPVSRTFAMQSFGFAGPLGQLATSAGANPISSSLGAGVPAMAGMDIVALPTIFGVPVATAALAGGGIGTAVAAAAGGGGGGGGGAGSVVPASP